jgi:hypothetical protein
MNDSLMWEKYLQNECDFSSALVITTDFMPYPAWCTQLVACALLAVCGVVLQLHPLSVFISEADLCIVTFLDCLYLTSS